MKKNKENKENKVKEEIKVSSFAKFAKFFNEPLTKNKYEEIKDNIRNI